MRQSLAPVLGVLGLTGGAGSSCLAVALAVRAARAGREVLLVDGHPYGGGLDLLVGDGLSAGLHWPDLTGARGSLDVEALWPRLPHLGSCAVLSWDRLPPEGSGQGADGSVWRELAGAAELTVVDLPARGTEAWVSWAGACSHVLGVHRSDVSGVAAAMVGVDDLLASLRGPELLGVVVRGTRQVPPEAISRAVRVPVLGVVDDDPGIDDALNRGVPVGVGDGALARCADVLLADHLLTLLRGAA